ncbi:DUF4407 domain-containing protein [Actinomadura hibisca]|uniref:DUF4407 domain-containing protein n=1 Tax=Actinomadura hibisca TaxID=68565 RepID=UPI00082DD01C|nr:DUF4407 domain-containing protein [Actinomadura hibisca]
MSRAGRPEEPLDPSAGAVAAFAQRLRELRRGSGLTLRQVAERAGYSPTTCTAAARGRTLPTWEVARAYVVACGGDEAEFQASWEEAAVSVGRPIDAHVPMGDPPDPAAAASVRDFLDLLAELRTWARLSLADLNKRADGHNVLPPSTVSETLKRGRLPKVSFVLAYARACGLEEERVREWVAAWEALDDRGRADEVEHVAPPVPPPGRGRVGPLLRRLIGVDEEVLDLVPQERGRYTSVSLLLLAATLMVGALTVLLVVSVLGNVAVALAVGVSWGLVLLALDRWLLASLPLGGGRGGALGTVVPRMVLASLMGLVIAEPLLLEVFGSEVNHEIQARHEQTLRTANARLHRCNPLLPLSTPRDCPSSILSESTLSQRQRLSTVIEQAKDLKAQVDSDLKQLTYLQETATRECTGQGGTGRPGDGPDCKRAKAEADAFRHDSRLVENQTGLGTLRGTGQSLALTVKTRIDREIATEVAVIRTRLSEAAGPLEQSTALGALSGRSLTVFAMTYLLRILVTVVSIAPIPALWLLHRSGYQRLLRHRLDETVRLAQQEAQARAEQQLQELVAITQVIGDLAQRLPGLKEQAGELALDELLEPLAEVRARLTEIAEPGDGQPTRRR